MVDPKSSGLRVTQIAIGAVIALVLPSGAVAVFGFHTDRGATADVVGVIFFVALIALFSTPWWPLPGRRDQSGYERLHSMCLLWFIVTFTTHLTWELAWLILHNRIAASPDSAWAYPWWMYIDGGDSRYAHAGPTLLTQEFLSMLNGLVGVTGLWLWWRSKGRSAAATLLLMATGVVHIYSAALYFGSEVLDGYPHVDTSSIADFWIKFWLLNGIWLVMPFAVFVWGRITLARQLRALPSELPADVAVPSGADPTDR
jgi:hypothetical protein